MLTQIKQFTIKIAALHIKAHC